MSATYSYEVKHESETKASKSAAQPWQLFAMYKGEAREVVGRYATKALAMAAKRRRDRK